LFHAYTFIQQKYVLIDKLCVAYGIVSRQMQCRISEYSLKAFVATSTAVLLLHWVEKCTYVDAGCISNAVKQYINNLVATVIFQPVIRFDVHINILVSFVVFIWIMVFFLL